jgi:hypothetical protein
LATAGSSIGGGGRVGCGWGSGEGGERAWYGVLVAW